MSEKEKQNEYQRRWRSKNKDHVNLWKRLWRKRNKKRDKEIRRSYYQRHKDVICNYNLLCYWAFVHENPDKMAERREYGNRRYAKLSEKKIAKRLIKIRWEIKNRKATYERWKASENYQAYLARQRAVQACKRLKNSDEMNFSCSHSPSR